MNNKTKRSSNWKCPVCSNYIFWDELYLDETMESILHVRGAVTVDSEAEARNVRRHRSPARLLRPLD